MPISVKLRKEFGLVVAQLDVPYDVPLNLEADRFPLLSGVDPYGDTVFNRRQMDRLLDEVAALIPGVTSE